MGRNNDAVINVALMNNFAEFEKEYLKFMQKMQDQAEVSIGFDKGQINEVSADIETEIASLKKKISKIQDTKLDNKTFEKFQQSVTKSIDALQAQATGLTDTMNQMMQSMTNVDNSEMTSWMKNITDSLAGMRQEALVTVEAVNAVRQISTTTGQHINMIQPGAAAQAKKEAEQVVNTYRILSKLADADNPYENVLDIQKLVQIYGDNATAIKKSVRQLYDEIIQLSKEATKAEQNNNEGQLNNLQRQIASKSQLWYDAYNSILDYSVAHKEDALVNNSLTESIQNQVDAIQSIIDNAIQSISQKHKQLVLEASFHDEDVAALEKPLSAGNIDIKANATELQKQAQDILTMVQGFLDAHPLEANVHLLSQWGNKKNQTAIKNFQKQIEKLTPNVNDKQLAKLQEAYKAVENSFHRDINLEIKTHFSEAEDKIETSINAIQSTLKQSKFDIRPSVGLSPESINKFKDDVQALADATTLIIKNIDIDKDSAKDAINQATLNGALNNLIENTTPLNNNMVLVWEHLIDIRDVLKSLPSATENIINSLNELARVMTTAFHITGGDELNSTFTNIQNRVAAIKGSISGDVKTELASLLREYEEYLNQGGTKSLQDLGGEKNVQNWLKRHMKTLQAEIKAENTNSAWSQVGNNITDSIGKGIETATPNIISAVDTMVDTALESAKDSNDGWEVVGRQAVGKFANGIEGNTPRVTQAIEGMVDAAFDVLNNSMDRSDSDAFSEAISQEVLGNLPNVADTVTNEFQEMAKSVDFDQAYKGIDNVNNTLGGMDSALSNLVGKIDDVQLLMTALQKLRDFQANDKSAEHGVDIRADGGISTKKGSAHSLSNPYVKGSILHGHTHPMGVAAMSIPHMEDGHLRGGDLGSFYQSFLKGIETQVIAGEKQLMIFNAKGFYQEAQAQGINFNSTKVKQAIADEFTKARKTIGQTEIESYFSRTNDFSEVVSTFNDSIINYLKSTVGLTGDTLEDYIKVINSVDASEIIKPGQIKKSADTLKTVKRGLQTYNKAFAANGLSEITWANSTDFEFIPRTAVDQIQNNVITQVISNAVRNLGYDDINLSKYVTTIPHDEVEKSLQSLTQQLKDATNSTSISGLQKYTENLQLMEKAASRAKGALKELHDEMANKPQSTQTSDSIDIEKTIQEKSQKLKDEQALLQKYANPKDATEQLLYDDAKDNVSRLTTELASLQAQKTQIIGVTTTETQAYQNQADVIDEIAEARKRLSQNKIESIDSALDKFSVPGASQRKIASEARSRLQPMSAKYQNSVSKGENWEEQYTYALKFIKLFETARDNTKGKSKVLEQYKGLYETLKPQAEKMESDLRKLFEDAPRNIIPTREIDGYIEETLTEAGNAGEKATNQIAEGADEARQKAEALSQEIVELQQQINALNQNTVGKVRNHLGQDTAYYKGIKGQKSTDDEKQLRELIKAYNEKINALSQLGYVRYSGQLLKQNHQPMDIIDDVTMKQLRSLASKDSNAHSILKRLAKYKATGAEQILDDIIGTLDSRGLNNQQLADKINEAAEAELERLTKTSVAKTKDSVKKSANEIHQIIDDIKNDAQSIDSPSSSATLTSKGQQVVEHMKQIAQAEGQVSKQTKEVGQQLENVQEKAQEVAEKVSQVSNEMKNEALVALDSAIQKNKQKLDEQQKLVEKYANNPETNFLYKDALENVEYYTKQLEHLQEQLELINSIPTNSVKSMSDETPISSNLTDKGKMLVEHMQETAKTENNIADNAQNISTEVDKAVQSAKTLDDIFADLKANIAQFGNYDLKYDTDKTAIASHIQQFREYQNQGGTKSLAELTDNKQALKKLKAEYKKEFGEIRSEALQTTQEVIADLHKMATTTADEVPKAYIKQRGSQTVDIKGEEGAKAVTEENAAFAAMPENANKAAISKREFAEANEAVLKSIIESIKGLGEESRGFSNLYKLINSIGGTKGDEKIDRVVESMMKLRSVFNLPMEENNTLLTQLNELASAGENLKDLAEVLKATRTKVKNALQLVANNKEKILSDPDATKLVSMYATDYLEKDGSFKVVDTQLAEVENGLVKVIALTKDANNQFQEFALQTKDGFTFETVGMDENTARIAKQLKIYRQVQQAFERMNADVQNATEDIFVPHDDSASWGLINQYLSEYGIHLGNIQKVIRSVRKDGNDLLESFHIIGEFGDIDFGKDHFLFDNHALVDIDKVVREYQTLTKKAQDYYRLKALERAGDATDDDVRHLRQIEKELDLINTEASRYLGLLNDFQMPQMYDSQEEFTTSLSRNYSNFINSYVTKMSNAIETKRMTNSNQRIRFADDVEEQVQVAEKALEELKAMLTNRHTIGWLDEDLERINELMQLVEKAKVAMKDKGGVETPYRQVTKLLSQVSDSINTNTAMPKNLMNEFRQLQSELMNVSHSADDAGNQIAHIDQIKFNQLKDRFHELTSQLEASGKKGSSFIDKISGAVVRNAAQFFARFASFYDLIRYGREIYSTINQLDYALVDLKKTTTMSTTDLNAFYKSANDIAKQNGVTTKTIIDQAAAWSRLSYSSKEEAETMAKLSSQFKAISPGMTEENATDGLVSTMQAFHIGVADVQREIMDNVNRIGNTMATSNDEIVEMLKRSSAAMQAANNTIEETIALESAAVQITRNAETTGTAFRTNEIVLMYSNVHISLLLIAGKT